VILAQVTLESPPAISLLAILVSAALTDNILLTRFLGMCSFLAVSRQMKSSLGLGLAVTTVTTFTAAINAALYRGVLEPLGLHISLKLILFIVVIAAFVQLMEMLIERLSLGLYYALGIFLPLITVNCAILGASLFMVIRKYSFIQTVGFGVGAGVGWAMAIVLIAGLQRKMLYSDVPRAFRGVAITMVITGVMAMAFMGFAGMVNIQ